MTTTTGIDGPETLSLLSDKSLDDATDDRLHFAAYADALADLQTIRRPTRPSRLRSMRSGVQARPH
jgi:hypothetical protein